MKSQSLIIQFILFFIIGLAIFLSLGNLFRIHSEMLRGDIANLYVKSINSYLSSAVISLVDSCKQCDSASLTLTLEKSVAGYFFDISLQNGLNVSTSLADKYFFSSIHKLNDSLTIEQAKLSSVKPITLTFDRTKNKLVMK